MSVRPQHLQSIVTACVALIFVLLGTQDIHAQYRLKRFSFNDLVNKSDVIFVASCKERETLYRHGNFVTHYQLKPSEFLKGQAKLNKNGNVDFEEMGGVTNYPLPLKQHYPGMADLDEGEEVLLFMAHKRIDREKTGLNYLEPVIPDGMLRVVGGETGVHRVVRHPETGEKILGRRSRQMLQLQSLNRGSSSNNDDNHEKNSAANTTGKDPGHDDKTKVILPGSLEYKRLQKKRKLAQAIDLAQEKAKRKRQAHIQRGSDRTFMRGANQGVISQFESLDSVRDRVKSVR
jgi:hypothetical protein